MGPNPTAAIIVALAVVMVIVAFKGTQDNWVTAVLGHAPSWAGGTARTGTARPAPGAPIVGQLPGLLPLVPGVTVL